MIGRDREAAFVAGLLDSVPRGRPFVLTVRGERGAGRSTVLRVAGDTARDAGFRVLATRGIRGEPAVGFSGLASLLRPLRDEVAGLPAPHQEAVASALSLRDHGGSATDLHLGVVQAFALAAERAPLLLLVDDADHLDQASTTTLGFALGQIGVDPIGAILSTDAAPCALDAVATEVLPLAGLARDALAAAVQAEVPCTDAVAAAIAGWADGSPLLALELARSLTSDELDGSAPLPEAPRPTVRSVERLQADLHALPEPVQRALVVAALDPSGSIAVVTSVLAALGEPPDSLDAAEASGHLVIDGEEVRFRQSIARPLAARLVAAASRQAAQRAISSVLAAPQQPADRLAEVLSAAELRVAEAVASGLTNRQAAEQLFLSIKTVDFHLQTIYRKLAIRSRAELATRVATRMERP